LTTARWFPVGRFRFVRGGIWLACIFSGKRLLNAEQRPIYVEIDFSTLFALSLDRLSLRDVFCGKLLISSSPATE
jgi:hypothetical protein